MANSLIPVADGWDLLGATRLRDLLVALADEYAPKAATVDLTMLRRAAHAALDSAKRRHRKGWRALALLHDSATVVRDRITSDDGSRAVRVDRSGPTAELLALAGSAASVVAHGESGVGKSALVVAAAVDAAAGSPGDTQAVCVNLRHLPRTGLELEAYLGAPLAVLLSELSAPQRLLVVDGADAVPEGAENVFRYLVDAARLADVTVIAVTAGDARQLVRDVVAECRGGDVTEYLVPPLTDAEVDQVTAVFGELAHLGANPRSRELLRRPVVVDLLVRGEVKGTPLSDADAMEQVWAGLVLRQGRSDRGRPYARNIALLNLADLALRGGDPLEVVSRIDQAALDGLIRDGLLRMPADDPFGIGPEFAHDEVRRYAVARLLLSEGDPAAKLAAAGVPRWSLGAARLACQALLAAAGTAANPAHGRLARMQQAFDGLVDAGHGDRWGDVPGEALLTLGDPGPVLRDAWAGLRAAPDAGLKRLSRLVDQRLTAREQAGPGRRCGAAHRPAARRRRRGVDGREAPAAPGPQLAPLPGRRRHAGRAPAPRSAARPARGRVRRRRQPPASRARGGGRRPRGPVGRGDRGGTRVPGAPPAPAVRAGRLPAQPTPQAPTAGPPRDHRRGDDRAARADRPRPRRPGRGHPRFASRGTRRRRSAPRWRRCSPAARWPDAGGGSWRS